MMLIAAAARRHRRRRRPPRRARQRRRRRGASRHADRAVRVGMTMADPGSGVGVRARAAPPPGVRLRHATRRARTGKLMTRAAGSRGSSHPPPASGRGSAQVGDWKCACASCIPVAVASPHKYTDGRYLTVIGDASHRFVFETDGSGSRDNAERPPPEVECGGGCGGSRFLGGIRARAPMRLARGVVQRLHDENGGAAGSAQSSSSKETSSQRRTVRSRSPPPRLTRWCGVPTDSSCDE